MQSTMNFFLCVCGFLSISSIYLVTKCMAHTFRPNENSFINRKETVLKHFGDKHQIYEDIIHRRQRLADKPIHLSSHGQKHKTRSESRRRRRENGSNFGNAIYFDGSGQLLKLRFITKQGRIVLPNEVFTVQFWAKPEGGQGRHTPIIDLFDDCKKKFPTSRWTVGIHADEHERRNARFMFSLLTEKASAVSVVSAHKRYDPNVWTNIAASYNGKTMRLYINGAKISNGHEQKGNIYSQSIAKCKVLTLGGNAVDGTFYRGKIDEVRLWNRELEHDEIVESMHKKVHDMTYDSNTLVMDQFDNLNQWRVSRGDDPKLVDSDIPVITHHVRLGAPSCGQTVCDDPEAILSYMNNSELRSKKVVRYTIVNLLNDDGSDPLISTKQVQVQNMALNDAFKPYNIEFLPDILDVNNSSIRQRIIMFDCQPHMIGDDHCDPECGHSSTGNDAGDCDLARTECFLKMVGNERCDAECNKAYYGYDNGDCCLPGSTTHLQCIDPNHPLRAYLHISELQEMLKLDGSSQLNIFFITASWQENTFRGISTYPWEKNVFTSSGGTIMHYKNFGKPGKLNALVHEMGHSLGLWHVHHGISEMKCDDACAELRPSMVLGDLCSDTNPTPRNRHCRDPLPNPLLDHEETCGFYSFKNTPFDNYMSYADDDCTNNFTPQQVARMHCYLDLVYQPLRKMKLQVPVPIAPKVILARSNSVTLVWLEPLGLDTTCDSKNAFHQYANTAESSHNGVRWSPQEATGFPDSERCHPSPSAWMPHFKTETETSSCDPGECWLELGFKTSVIPRRLSIWVADIDVSVTLTVTLMLPDGSELLLGAIPAYCDIETTMMIDTEEPVSKIRIYTNDKNIAIDAVELVSRSNFPECTKKKSPKYKIIRDPPFLEDYTVTGDTEYEDMTVEDGITYKYRVQTLMDSTVSKLSPALEYTHGQSFCGDGHVGSLEECDDKNVLDGDGCSIECRIEENFNCKGHPSLCYISEGDGVCEDFERETSISDCGFFTPDGFVDQWVSSAIANPEFQDSECPELAIVGPPSQLQVRVVIVVPGFVRLYKNKIHELWRMEYFPYRRTNRSEMALVGPLSQQQRCEVYSGASIWRPCGEFHDTYGDFWLEAFIPHPVVAVAIVIHLGSDGLTPVNTETKYMHVDLITTGNQTIPVEPRNIPVTCWENPIHVTLKQDLSLPFTLTQGVRISFTYSSISIAAVRIRSSPYIDPVKLASCKEKELYDVRSGQCTEQSCSKSVCGTFLIKHGVADCSGSEEGDTCSVLCDSGYELSGHKNKAVCAQGSWMASSSLICVPVDCHRPVIPYATAACSDGTTYDSECIFKCDKPAKMVGNITTMRCQENGRWTAQEAFCEIKCDPLRLDADNNGKLKTLTCFDEEQDVGQQCKIRCNEGYHVEGERIKKRSLTLICGEDGEWSGPVCVQNQCPPIPALFAGAYTCSDYLYRRSTCIMSCPGDLELIQSITCKTNGEWNGQFTVCPSLKTESCPIIESNKDVVVSCKRNTVGEKCDVECTDPTHTPMYKRGHDERYQMRPISSVDEVECSVMLTWTPNPDRIFCVKRCIEEAIGDGFCDADNNREACDWDGGDCCSSTVEDGNVITFPEHCPIDCKCRDPAAVENRRRRRRHKLKYMALLQSTGLP